MTKRRKENRDSTLAVVLKRPIISPLGRRNKCFSRLVHQAGVYTEGFNLGVVFDQQGSPIKARTCTPRKRDLNKLPLTYQISCGQLSPVKICFFACKSRLYHRSPKVLKFGHLMPFSNSTKGFDNVEVTVERLNQWTNCLRSVSQNKVMGGISAREHVNQYIDMENVNPDTAWDWLHLFAHSLGGHDGKNPQIQGNLVAGTHACNILMLEFAETALKSFIREHQLSGVTLSVSAELLPFNGSYTHIATQIHYCIQYQERFVRISFDPLGEIGVEPKQHAFQVKRLLENSLLGLSEEENQSRPIIRV